jgi:hypothetical protein
MDGIDGVMQLVDGIAGDAPSVVHVEGADEWIFADWVVGNVAAALHVRLPGKNPDVADENVTDSEPFAAYGERDVVRAADVEAVKTRRETPASRPSDGAVLPAGERPFVTDNVRHDIPFPGACAAHKCVAHAIGAALEHHVWKKT